MYSQRATQIRTTKTSRTKAAAVPAPLPGRAPFHPLLQLQQIAGNQAVQRLLRSWSSQAKLSVIRSGDIDGVNCVAEKAMKKAEAFLQRTTITRSLSDHPVSIQCEDDEQAPDRPASNKANKKAELEYHSALHFNRGFSGFNPTREPEEGESAIIWWSVWNPGWIPAPEHTNRLTIYDANLCSGCRKDEDEILRSDIRGPSIVSGEQQGKSEYENAVLVGISFKAGHYEAVVDLDVHNQVDEINEDNNRAFLTFTVRPGKDVE